MSGASDKKLMISALIRCMDHIEEKQKWGKRFHWTNFHYNQLSEKIYEKTGHLISYNTLKRIFGKVNTSDNYTPRTSTLDILAMFLDHKDWRNYCDHLQKQPDKNTDETLKPVKARFSTKRRMLYFITLFAGVISVSFLTIISLQSKDIFKQHIPFKVEVRSTGSEDGYSVNFSSFASKSQLEGFSLQFGDSAEVLLDSLYRNGQFEFSHIYKLPGYYKAQLKREGEKVQVVPVHIKTDGWNAALSLNPADNNRVFFPLQRKDFVTESGKLLVSNRLLKNKLSFGQLAWGYATSFFNYFDSDIDGQFVLESEIGFEHMQKSMFCEKVKIIISGSESDIAVIFTQQACVSEASIEVGDYVLQGQDANLSAMGLDLYQLRKIIISADDNSVDIISGDDLLYRLPYRQSMGKIKGITFEFLGNGYLESVKLTDKFAEKKLLAACEMI